MHSLNSPRASTYTKLLLGLKFSMLQTTIMYNVNFNRHVTCMQDRSKKISDIRTGKNGWYNGTFPWPIDIPTQTYLGSTPRLIHPDLTHLV